MPFLQCPNCFFSVRRPVSGIDPVACPRCRAKGPVTALVGVPRIRGQADGLEKRFVWQAVLDDEARGHRWLS